MKKEELRCKSKIGLDKAKNIKESGRCGRWGKGGRVGVAGSGNEMRELNTEYIQGNLASTPKTRGCMHNEDVHLGSNVIPILVAAQCY